MKPEVLAIVQRHARLFPNGFPMKCQAALIEDRPDAQRKIIYDDQEKALAARDELEKLPGAPRLRVYPCPRSLHGHYHLTTDGHAAKVYARRNDDGA
jgi:hypothetical protein